jgi:hypothetical protein
MAFSAVLERFMTKSPFAVLARGLWENVFALQAIPRRQVRQGRQVAPQETSPTSPLVRLGLQPRWPCSTFHPRLRTVGSSGRGRPATLVLEEKWPYCG